MSARKEILRPRSSTTPAPLGCCCSRRWFLASLTRYRQQQAALATVSAYLPLRPRRSLAHLLRQAALQSVHEIDDGAGDLNRLRLHRETSHFRLDELPQRLLVTVAEDR